MEDKYSREEFNILDFRDIEIEKRHKPSQEDIEQLKYIKKLRQDNKKLFYPQESIEQDIGFLLSQDVRGKNKAELLKLIIFKLQELQIQKHILDFSRDFLRNLFKDYSDINIRKLQRRMEELLIYAKAKERVKTNYYLVNAKVDKIREPRNKIFQAYSFLS